MAKEKFAQMGYISVTESAANTLTFAGLSVFSNVLGQKGMIIHRIQYDPTAAMWEDLAASGDAFVMGLAGVDSLTSISLDDPEVYDYNNIVANQYGTPANVLIDNISIVKRFDDLPGGGLLVPADRLYGFLRGSSLAAAGQVYIRWFYSIIDLSASDYLELAQSMRVLK